MGKYFNSIEIQFFALSSEPSRFRSLEGGLSSPPKGGLENPPSVTAQTGPIIEDEDDWLFPNLTIQTVHYINSPHRTQRAQRIAV